MLICMHNWEYMDDRQRLEAEPPLKEAVVAFVRVAMIGSRIAFACKSEASLQCVA